MDKIDPEAGWVCFFGVPLCTYATSRGNSKPPSDKTLLLLQLYVKVTTLMIPSGVYIDGRGGAFWYVSSRRIEYRPLMAPRVPRAVVRANIPINDTSDCTTRTTLTTSLQSTWPTLRPGILVTYKHLEAVPLTVGSPARLSRQHRMCVQQTLNHTELVSFFSWWNFHLLSVLLLTAATTAASAAPEATPEKPHVERRRATIRARCGDGTSGGREAGS